MKIRASSNWLTDSEINPPASKTASAAPKLYNKMSGFVPGPLESFFCEAKLLAYFDSFYFQSRTSKHNLDCFDWSKSTNISLCFALLCTTHLHKYTNMKKFITVTWK